MARGLDAAAPAAAEQVGCGRNKPPPPAWPDALPVVDDCPRRSPREAKPSESARIWWEGGKDCCIAGESMLFAGGSERRSLEWESWMDIRCKHICQPIGA